MSDLMMKREHDSTDDFEHLEHELQRGEAVSGAGGNEQPLLDISASPPKLRNDFSPDLLSNDRHPLMSDNLLDTSIPSLNNGAGDPVLVSSAGDFIPATPPPSADSTELDAVVQQQHSDELAARIRQQLTDPKTASMAFMESEKSSFHRDLDLNSDSAARFNDQFGDDSEDDNTEAERSEASQTRAAPMLSNFQDDLLDQQQQQQQHEFQNNQRNLLDDEDDDDDDDMFAKEDFSSLKERSEVPKSLYDIDKDDFMGEIRSSTLPQPEKSPEVDYLKDELIVHEETREKPVVASQPAGQPQGLLDDAEWNVLDRFEDKETVAASAPAPPAHEPYLEFEHTKPLPPLPQGVEDDIFDDMEQELSAKEANNKYQMSNDFLSAEAKRFEGASGGETDEFESEPERSPAKSAPMPRPAAPIPQQAPAPAVAAARPNNDKVNSSNGDLDFFDSFKPDAWFNPERLHPKVASLIYWRDVKKSGIVFGATLTVLLSLAYFSLISVLAYSSLLTLTYTILFRIYKTVLQAIQKTSDGHPFQEILELDLTVPSEKVHAVADVAVNQVNAGVSELRRLFLVEDFVDSLKFGILLWTLTYLGAWFNGMTLVIIGVIALFTLPKVYETNKTQIDQHLGAVKAKVDEITAKVKAALPIGKKEEKKD
ncbi:reticulon-1 isoform X1 [Trichogramma pretiosum]|uniref:reticulon-1 isoform X1 n=1 Tax=Trichogramma pretiosum TaxID=7493 RepID=UPI0006C9E55B|nr:reticulon-1 isoform X1 [Trichogramma pretiosum]